LQELEQAACQFIFLVEKMRSGNLYRVQWRHEKLRAIEECVQTGTSIFLRAKPQDACVSLLADYSVSALDCVCCSTLLAITTAKSWHAAKQCNNSGERQNSC
jgi:hypothetical protein